MSKKQKATNELIAGLDLQIADLKADVARLEAETEDELADRCSWYSEKTYELEETVIELQEENAALRRRIEHLLAALAA